MPGKRGTVAARFWPKVDKAGPVPEFAAHLGPCWIWTAQTVDGYGVFRVGAGISPRRAHRVAYELIVGPIADGLELDHLCRVHACVRPAHLEPVTGAENRRRADGWAGLNARKTRCPAGHEYTPENLARDPKGRACKVCRRDAQARYVARKRAERVST